MPLTGIGPDAIKKGGEELWNNHLRFNLVLNRLEQRVILGFEERTFNKTEFEKCFSLRCPEFYWGRL